MSIYSYYAKLMKPYLWRYVIGFSGVIVNVLDMVIPYFIAVSIDAAMNNTPDSEKIIFSALIWILVIAISRTFTFVTSRYLLVSASRYIGYDLKNQIYSKLVTLSDKFFIGMSTGEIMNRASSDVQTVMMFLGYGSNLLPNALLRTLIGSVMMFVLSWKLALCVLAFVPFIFLLEYSFGRKIHNLWKNVQKYSDKVVARVQENFTGARTVRTYNQEENEKKMFDGLTDGSIETVRPLLILDSYFWPLLNVISWLAILVLIWYGGNLIISNEVTFGALSAFVAYVSMLIWPIISLGHIVNMYQRASASLKRIVEITEAVPEIKTPVNAYNPSKVDGEIVLENVTLTYDSELVYLDDISIRIPKGQVLGIVGPVGSGKSSFAKLLLRIWDPQKGNVRMDGIDLREWDLKKLRQSIGFVPQDTFLFSTTLSENIAFAKPSATKEEIEKIAEMVQIKSEIEKFPKGFETVVGERGVTLSGGQRQRVSIARALLIDPPVMVFDDPLSAVDTSTEDAIIKTLKPVIKGKTVIIIAHRVSAMSLADRIIVLDKGKIVEDGTQSELMKLNGYYANLVEKQKLASEIGEEVTNA
jgi:ATP-binding cassette subfamily B protein